MHILVKGRSVRPGVVIIAVLSGALMIGLSLSSRAAPVLRGPVLQEQEVAASQDVDDAGAAGSVAGENYNDRFRRRINAEKARDRVQHPLAAMHPEHFAVVCEAGCGSGYSDVVDLTPRRVQDPVPPPSRSSSAAPVRNEIVCVGGCYSDAGPEVTASDFSSAGDMPDWMAAPEPGPNQPATRTLRRWYDRIGDTEGR